MQLQSVVFCPEAQCINRVWRGEGRGSCKQNRMGTWRGANYFQQGTGTIMVHPKDASCAALVQSGFPSPNGFSRLYGQIQIWRQRALIQHLPQRGVLCANSESEAYLQCLRGGGCNGCQLWQGAAWGEKWSAFWPIHPPLHPKWNDSGRWGMWQGGNARRAVMLPHLPACFELVTILQCITAKFC